MRVFIYQGPTIALLLGLLLPAIALAQPNPPANDCWECELEPGSQTRWTCGGPGGMPHQPPYCYGTMPFHIGCWDCETEGDDAGVASLLHQLAPDGSLLGDSDARLALQRRPASGAPLSDGQVVVWSCTGKIMARHFSESAAMRVRKVTSVIDI